MIFQKLVPEAKQFLDVVGNLSGDELEDEDGDFDDVLSNLTDVVKTLMELFK